MKDQRMTAEYQRNVSEFVGREVNYCVSHLVYELAQKVEAFPEYCDELYRAFYGEPDYEEAASDNGWTINERGEFSREDENGCTIIHFADDWAELCEFELIDANDYRPEIFEHWIVSDWLAGKLTEHGELILSDFFGLTIWGRATTGQSIAIDNVICDIYDSTQLPALNAVGGA